MRSSRLGSSGSSCWPCWTRTGWPPCMNASPEQHLLGHSQLLGHSTVAKSHGMNRSWGYLTHLTMRTQRDWKVPWKKALQWDEHKWLAPQRQSQSKPVLICSAIQGMIWICWVFPSSLSVHLSPVFQLDLPVLAAPMYKPLQRQEELEIGTQPPGRQWVQDKPMIKHIPIIS